MTNLGDKTVCRVCGGVLIAVKDRTVISLTAGVWVHAGRLRWLRNHPPRPWSQP